MVARATKLPSLLPSVKTSTWRCHDPEREAADAEFQAIRLAVVKRDMFRCHFCSFQSAPGTAPRAAAGAIRKPRVLAPSGYLEVHHLDDDHGNNSPENLITACPYCHQVFHAGNAGHDSRVRLIWLPWLDQTDLNLLVHALFAAIDMNSKYAKEAQRLYSLISGFAGRLTQRFGEGLADPASLGSVLMTIHRESPEIYAEREKALWGVRLLPEIDAFERQRRHWAEHVWSNIPPDTWKQIYQSCLKRFEKQS